MLTILVTEEFEKRYRILPTNIKRRAVKQQKLFCQNHFHSGAPCVSLDEMENEENETGA